MSEGNIVQRTGLEDGVSPPWVDKGLNNKYSKKSHYDVIKVNDEQPDFHDKVPLEATVQGRIAVYTPYRESGQMQEAMSRLLVPERFSLHIESVQNPRMDSLAQEVIPHYDVYIIDASRNDLSREQTERLAEFSRDVKRRYPYSGILLLGNKEVYRKELYNPLKQAYSQQRTIDAIVEGTSSTSPERIMGYLSGVFMDHLRRMCRLPYVIKIGGSVMDLAMTDMSILTNLLEEIKDLHDEGYIFILTAGGGPGQSINRRLSPSIEWLEEQSKSTLRGNALLIRDKLGELGATAIYVEPEDLGIVQPSREYLQNVIPIVTLSNDRSIPASQSDIHTLDIAERYSIYRVLFAKDARGMHDRDPNIPENAVITAEDLDRVTPEEAALLLRKMVGSNKIYRTITAQEILNGAISRVGTDVEGDKRVLTPNHLIEKGALERYIGSRIRYIRIVDGKNPQDVRTAITESWQPIGTCIIHSDRYVA